MSELILVDGTAVDAIVAVPVDSVTLIHFKRKRNFSTRWTDPCRCLRSLLFFFVFFSFYLTEFWFSWRTFRWRGAGSTRPPSLWRPSAARGAPIAAVPPRSRPVRDSCATCWYLKPSKNSVTWIQKETIQKTNYLVRNCTEFYLVSRKGITGTVLKETRLLWVLGRSGWLAGSELPMSIQWGSRWTGSDDQRRIWRRNLASASGCQRKVTFKSSRRLAARTSWCTPHGSRPKPRHSKSASGTSWRR